jgi:Flp pilus assembly protein TadB
LAAEGRSGGGRRALGRVVLVSLAERTRAELDERRARGQRLRAQRTLRRLEELERALDRFDRGLAPLPTPWYLRRGALAAAVAVLLATVGTLVAAVAIHGPSGVIVGVADVAMLVATLVWFSIAVARRAPRDGVPGPHPNEGSPGEDGGR